MNAGLFCLATIGPALNLQACSGIQARESAPLTAPNLVRVGMPESLIREARSIFVYDERGHFGTKTQYNSASMNTGGGSLVVHCRDGVCFGVEVKYDENGVKRSDAVALMRQLLSIGDAAPVEHDDADITKNDAKRRAEFFYFEKDSAKTEPGAGSTGGSPAASALQGQPDVGLRGELYYAAAPSNRVNQIAVWYE